MPLALSVLRFRSNVTQSFKTVFSGVHLLIDNVQKFKQPFLILSGIESKVYLTVASRTGTDLENSQQPAEIDLQTRDFVVGDEFHFVPAVVFTNLFNAFFNINDTP